MGWVDGARLLWDWGVMRRGLGEGCLWWWDYMIWRVMEIEGCIRMGV